MQLIKLLKIKCTMNLVELREITGVEIKEQIGHALGRVEMCTLMSVRNFRRIVMKQREAETDLQRSTGVTQRFINIKERQQVVNMLNNIIFNRNRSSRKEGQVIIGKKQSRINKPKNKHRAAKHTKWYWQTSF